jgi:lipopolysaccharide/colanic/teichoic acid biosynthesis glycosyltransferase
MEAIQYQQFKNYSTSASPNYEDPKNYLIVGEGYFSINGNQFHLDSTWQSSFDTLLNRLQTVFKTEPYDPILVLLDLSSTSKYFKEFSCVENQRKYFPESIFLWNSGKLSIPEINHLIKTGAAIDFIDNDFDLVQITAKVRFLLKFKQVSGGPNFLYQGNIHTIDSRFGSSMICKRFFDIFLSLLLLLLLLPLFILVSIAIKLESSGPIFYVSNRVGRNYRVFPMIKFRSMQNGADLLLNQIKHLNVYGKESVASPFLKIKDDPRVSYVGKFLRKTSVDEFPQLINVLMGHMSIVGNRPLPLYEAEKLLTNKYVKRFDAPAGITGLWQVVKKRFPNMDEEERIELDIQYSREFSLVKDFWILLKTPGALLQNQNY